MFFKKTQEPELTPAELIKKRAANLATIFVVQAMLIGFVYLISIASTP